MDPINTQYLSRREVIAHVSDLLLDHLKRAYTNKVSFIPYTEFNNLVHGNVQKEHAYALKKAKDIALVEHGVVTLTVKGKGLKLVQEAYKAQFAGDEARKRIDTATKTWERRHNSVDVSQLDSRGLTRYAFECLKLDTQKQINAGARDAALKAAVESAKPEDPLSAKNIRRMVKEAARINAGIG